MEEAKTMRTIVGLLAAISCGSLAAWTVNRPAPEASHRLAVAASTANDSAHLAVPLEAAEDDGFNANVLDELFKHVDPDTALYARLRQMRGHLDAAQELHAAGEHKHVLQHIRHPVEEVYDDIAAELSKRRHPGFLGELTSLEATYSAGKTEAEIGTAFSKVVDAIASAEATIPKAKLESPSFTLDTIALLLRSAALEYKEAYEHMRITNVIEYHDGRGFVREARAMLEEVAPALKVRDPQSYATVLDAFTELETAWPTAMPPERPAKPRTVLHGFVSLVELHANRLR